MTRDMHALVKAGYEDNDYAGVFRTNSEPTPFEIGFLERLNQVLPVNTQILDLGSGTGVPYDRYLVNQGYSLTGVDFSSKLIRMARQNVPQALYLEGDFSKVEFPLQSFDAVVCFYAIFHLPRAEQPALFARIQGWLKPGGLLLGTLGTSNEEYIEEVDFIGARMAWSSYSPDIYRRILAETGFTILHSDYEGAPGDEEYHYWLLARRAI